MPPIIVALWPLLLVCLQSLVSYLVGQRIFESLLLVGLRQFCKRWPNPVVIELAIAWADAVGKRALLGDLQAPEAPAVDLPAISNKPPSGEAGFAWLPVLLVAALLLMVGATCFRAGMAYSQPVPVAVTPHPQYTQADGSTVAARTSATVMPTVALPAGATPTATARITLKPRAPVVPNGQVMLPECAPLICPAIALDVATTRSSDGQTDMVLRADSAEIDSAIYAPAPLLLEKKHRNALGLIRTHDGDMLAAYERDSGPLRVGLGIGPGAWQIAVLWRY